MPTRSRRGRSAIAGEHSFRGSGPRDRARRGIGRGRTLRPGDREAQRLLQETLFPTETRSPPHGRRRRPRSAKAPDELDRPEDDVLDNPELSRMMQETGAAAASEADRVAAEEGAEAAAEITSDPVVSTDDGHFLTTEELQSLGEVFGHFPISEEVYDDQATLGFPSSGWNTVQDELRTLRFSMDDLRTGLSEFDALRLLLAEIKTEVEIGHRSREALASSLLSLTGDVQELRAKLDATSRSAVASARSVNRLNDRIESVPDRSLGRRLRDHASRTVISAVALGFLAVSLILACYLRTGDLRTTLLAIVAVNFAGCVAILAGRRRRWA